MAPAVGSIVPVGTAVGVPGLGDVVGGVVAVGVPGAGVGVRDGVGEGIRVPDVAKGVGVRVPIIVATVVGVPVGIWLVGVADGPIVGGGVADCVAGPGGCGVPGGIGLRSGGG